MDLKTRKLNMIEYLIQLNDEILFEKIERFISSEEVDYTKSGPFNKEELEERAKRSNEDYPKGRVVSQEELEIQSERDSETYDFWDDLTPAQKDEIKKASSEIEEGKAIDYESFIAKHR